MKKHQQKDYRLAGSLLVLIIAVAVVGIINYATAQPSFTQTPDSTFRGEVIKGTSQIAAANLLAEGNPFITGELIFGDTGMTATGTPALYGGFTSINISEELRFGDDDDKDDEGYSQWLVVRDCTDATTTLMSFQNTYGEYVYLRDAWVQVLGKATSAVHFAMSTTTVPYYAQDNSTILVGDNVGNLMRTFPSLGIDDGSVPTGTNAYMGNFGGTATAVANKVPVLIHPDWYIVAQASTTNDGTNWQITNTANTLDCEIYMVFERTD